MSWYEGDPTQSARSKGMRERCGLNSIGLMGPWPGKLALAARPRGGEWLHDELANWRREGVHTVFSLLTPEEEQDLDLTDEKRETQAQGMTFRSFPIPDRQVPDSESKLAKSRQGIGRSGLVAACLFITKGLETKAAVKRLSAARGTHIPESNEQRRWIDHFASTVADLK